MTEYMTYDDISKRTGISVGALRVRLHKGRFPEPDINRGKPMWKPETVEQWIGEQNAVTRPD